MLQCNERIKAVDKQLRYILEKTVVYKEKKK